MQFLRSTAKSKELFQMKPRQIEAMGLYCKLLSQCSCATQVMKM